MCQFSGCGSAFAVIREYQNFSSKLFSFSEGCVTSGRISYSGAFMLSTMLMPQI